MDVVLHLADHYAFDNFYEYVEKGIPAVVGTLQATATAMGVNWIQQPLFNQDGNPRHLAATELQDTLFGLLERDAIFRQSLTFTIITLIFAHLLYFSFGTISYFFFFDRNLEKHPRFLKNQIRKEIALSVSGFPLTTLLTVPWLVGEVRGYSQLFEGLKYGWAYTVFSAVFFLVFTDACIYWIHRWLHTPTVYRYLHKPHHRWLVPTPFASHAFHPLDGYIQSVPYHLFVYMIPINKYLYLVLFVLVNIWTVGIHSGYFPSIPLVNGPGHHTVHHMDFNYNYGQYLTWMDKLGGTYREPRNEAKAISGSKSM